MKTKHILAKLLLLVLFLVSGIKSDAQDWVSKMQDHNASLYEVQDEFYQYYYQYKADFKKNTGAEPERVPGFKQFKRWEWFMQPRVKANGTRFSPDILWKESQKLQSRMQQSNAGNWNLIGPSVIPGSNGGAGRLNFVRVHPNDPNTLFVGSPAGGLWKSTDGGINWNTQTDFLPHVIGCTDLAIDPNNPNVMYLATGDGDAGDTYSVGVLKSTDGGNTWFQTGLAYSSSNYRLISKILIDPSNTNVVLAAGSAGVYRSDDAGATFNRVQTGSFKDMEFKPGDPNTVYVAGAEVYRSLNNGQSFFKLSTGLPNVNNVSRIAIGVTENDPNYVYLIVGLPAPNYGTEGFYRSTNSGSSFSKLSVPALGNQQWYDLCIAVSPADKNQILVGGQTDFIRSTNGGVSWSQSGAGTHVDYHDVIYYNSTICYMANDGGIYKSATAGVSWNNISSGLEIAQMYGFGQSASNPNLLLQGWQDNGTNMFNNGSWNKVLGGDGMLCFIDYNNSNNMWAETQYGGLARSTNGGASFTSATGNINETGGWVTPWLQDPVNSSTIYAGFVNVWKSTNGGTSWTKISNFSNAATLNTIAVSPAGNNVIWAAKSGTLYLTTNGGSTWTEIASAPAGTITAIACHDSDPQKAYITYSGFANTVKVFSTTDSGNSWNNMSASLPNVPVNTIVYVDGSNDGVYVGTDLGVFYRDASLTVWEPFFNGLPHVIVSQLAIFYPTGKIRASTYGRGIWESDLYVPGNYAPTASFISDKQQSCPGAAVQFTDYSAGSPASWEWSFPGGQPATSTQQNPTVYYNNPGVYDVSLIVTNAIGTDTLVFPAMVEIFNSSNSGPSTVGDQRCGAGQVNLSASGSGAGTLTWWDAPGGGNVIATGNNYSPNITQTTTYWVDESFSGGFTDFTGETSNLVGTGAFFTANDIRGLYFDVLAPVVINSFEVYSNSAANRTIEILDSQGNTIADTTIFIPASPNTPYVLNVNFTVYPGTDFFIKCRGYVDLYRNSSGATYPYTGAYVNITESNASVPGYYYFFYNWIYTEINCNTPRTAVIAQDTCAVGLQELTGAASLQLFPNPSNGKFDCTFEAQGNEDYQLEIFNMAGERVYQNRFTNLTGKVTRQINLSNVGSGIYMVAFTDKYGTTRRRMVIN